MLGSQIFRMLKESTRISSRLFSFMNPLAFEIWLYMGCAYCIVSITLWIVARFCPREWHEIELCDDCLLEKYEGICDDVKTYRSGSSGIGSDEEHGPVVKKN